MILIKNPNQCPGCAKFNSLRWDQHRCCECNAKIFKPENNFVALKEECTFAYWVYFPLNSSGNYRGWVHSSHLKDDPTPNLPDFKFEKPDKNYGKKDKVKKGSASVKAEDMGAEKFRVSSL